MKNLKTALDYIRYAATEMSKYPLHYGHGMESPLDEAAALVIGLIKLPFDIDIRYLYTNLTEPEKTQIINALRMRIEDRMPVAYLTQRTLYGGYEFYIDDRALIPRSPIAELIQKGLKPYWKGEEPERILDLCCGSGCIGILAKYHYPFAEVVLADNDPHALAVAKKNIELAQMQDCGVQSLETDLFSNVKGQFDWILCNPPYVEEQEGEEFAEEYRHEPRQALFAGADGLDLVKKILPQAADYLTDNGVLILEVGQSYQNLQDYYPEIGFDWVSFENGGEGVFAVSKDELMAWQQAGLI